jgi:hypothetical protein
MKVTLPVLGLFLVLMSVQSAFAQAGPQGPGKTTWKLASLSFTRLMTP